MGIKLKPSGWGIKINQKNAKKTWDRHSCIHQQNECSKSGEDHKTLKSHKKKNINIKIKITQFLLKISPIILGFMAVVFKSDMLGYITLGSFIMLILYLYNNIQYNKIKTLKK